MQKIFINDNPLFLIDTLEGIEMNKNDQVFTYEDENSLEEMIQFLETKSPNEHDRFYFYSKDINEAEKHFASLYKPIEAAGGAVKNNKGEILFIFRHGKWDLPKGKIEQGENKSDAAVREVQEECGIENLSVIKELPPTYHTYNADNQRFLKKTYWFEMSCFGNEELKPQTEESITEAKWMDHQEVKAALKNSYHSINDVIWSLKI